MSLWDKVLHLFGTSRVQQRWRREWARERKERGGGSTTVRTALVPRDFPLVTAVLGGACLVVYVLSLRVSDSMCGEGGLTPSQIALVRLGAAFAPFVRAGEWWRSVTAIFLHADALHILMNFLGLWFVVAAAEDRFGRARTFVAFVLTGTVGELASSWWNANALSIGASGGIFGLMGLCVAHAVHRRDAELKARFLPWVIYGLIIGFASGRVDNAAHVGGLVTGALLGIVLGDEGQVRRLPRWAWSLASGLAVVLIGYSFWMAMHSPFLEDLQ